MEKLYPSVIPKIPNLIKEYLEKSMGQVGSAGNTYGDINTVEGIYKTEQAHSKGERLHLLIDGVRKHDARAKLILDQAEELHTEWLNHQAEAAAMRAKLLEDFGITIQPEIRNAG